MRCSNITKLSLWQLSMTEIDILEVTLLLGTSTNVSSVGYVSS